MVVCRSTSLNCQTHDEGDHIAAACSRSGGYSYPFKSMPGRYRMLLLAIRSMVEPRAPSQQSRCTVKQAEDPSTMLHGPGLSKARLWPEQVRLTAQGPSASACSRSRKPAGCMPTSL